MVSKKGEKRGKEANATRRLRLILSAGEMSTALARKI